MKYIGVYDAVAIRHPEIKNTGGTNSLQCYQLYNQALSLKEFVFTRDACIVYRKLPLVTCALLFSLSFLFLLYLSSMTARIAFRYSFLSSAPIILRPLIPPTPLLLYSPVLPSHSSLCCVS